MDSVVQFLYFVAALLVTLSVHEAAHAATSYYLGDPTAKVEGRVTLNPVAHLDLVGSLLFLITQTVGWGKPVPVNPRNFKHPVRDSALTALAGPVSNFLLSFLMAILWKYAGPYLPDQVTLFFQMIFHVSIYLGLFNLFPFPPLDGSKIVGLIIPRKWYRQYEDYLENGVKYFVAIILIDGFILPDLIGFSFLGYVVSFLHDRVSLILLLGT
jgi:Zn-dependent protease